MKSWHRFYDPNTRSYISADPIGLRGGINLYAYIGGDPVNETDVFGLSPNGPQWYREQERFSAGTGTGIALGLNWGGVLTLPNQGQNSPHTGGGAMSLVFFPQVCEIALYSIYPLDVTVGEAVALVNNLVKEGSLISAGYNGEAAFFVGNPANADALSFEGIFHTGQTGYIEGASGYVGEPLPSDEFWVGGTIGLVSGTAGVGLVDWEYSIIGGPWTLPECMCESLKSKKP